MQEVKRISKEETREHMHEESTVIIDVRRQQAEARTKVATAELRDPDKVETWAGNYRKDQLLILYCA